jgi:antitoxin CptB
MSDTAKLRWHCRRGMLELDLLLIRYLESRYPYASIEEQKAFRELLELEDNQLHAYLLDTPCFADANLGSLLAIIRQPVVLVKA